MFDFSIVTHWIDNLLRSVMPGWGALLVEFVLVGVVLLLLYAVLALFYIYFERKVCAFFQCRLGPNRVGPYGIIQSVADMFKILIKELITLNHIDKVTIFQRPGRISSGCPMPMPISIRATEKAMVAGKIER